VVAVGIAAEGAADESSVEGSTAFSMTSRRPDPTTEGEEIVALPRLVARGAVSQANPAPTATAAVPKAMSMARFRPSPSVGPKTSPVRVSAVAVSANS
jgi:hypothetical protein